MPFTPQQLREIKERSRKLVLKAQEIRYQVERAQLNARDLAGTLRQRRTRSARSQKLRFDTNAV